MSALLHNSDRALAWLTQVLLDPNATADIPCCKNLGHDQRCRQLGWVDPVMVVVLQGSA